jgi:ABC-2 type transport system ATP-binding protein
MPILEIDHLSFQFRKKPIFTNAQLTLTQQGVYGLVAPNGTGKSTVLNLIAGILQPDKGTIRIMDRPNSPATVFAYVSYAQSAEHFLPEMKGSDYVTLFQKAHQLNKQRVDAVIARLGVDSFQKERIRTYSMGMKQRLTLAIALMIDAPLLLLDEPLNGLDPDSLAIIRRTIIQEGQSGHTVLLASHNLDELARVTKQGFVIVNQQIQPVSFTDSLNLEKVYRHYFPE